MASTFRAVQSAARTLVSKTLRTDVKQFHTSGIQCLFGDESLGLDNYQRQRLYMQEKVGDLKERFRLRMEEYINSSSTNTIFTDDLKTIVHVAETQDDLDTTIKMVKRFHGQTSVLRFSNFVFGPLVMRMLHSLKRPDIAYTLFTDPELKGFFTQMSSYIVLMDLLFEAGEYEKVLEVSRIVRENQLAGIHQPVDCVTLAAGACLKLNTSESFQFALGLLKDCQKDGSNLSLRTIVYLVYLAIKQNDSAIARELLSVSQGSRSGRVPVAYGNVKAIVLAKQNSAREAIGLLEDMVKQDSPDQSVRGPSIFPETITALEEAAQTSQDKETQVLLTQLKEELQRSNHVTETTFEEYIFGTIIRRRNLQDGFKRRPRSGVDGYRRPDGRRDFHRQGLKDDDHMVI